MNCAYQMAEGQCGAEIVRDPASYSGWKHEHEAFATPFGQEKVDWLHWASPIAYGPQSASMSGVFKPCAICGKTGPDNEEHELFTGHRFVAA